MATGKPIGYPIGTAVGKAISDAPHHAGGAVETPFFATLIPGPDGEISTATAMGTGDPTFTRATTAMVRDYNNVWHSVSSGEARIQGARYDSGTYYWKLASGEQLHPTAVKGGATLFATYDKWEASTAYSVGDKIIPATGSGPAGGDGWCYECTTAGTSDSSEPTFDNTIGNTTADNTVVWTCISRYTIAGYLAEPQRTNQLNYSYDLTQWTQEGTSVSALDETGIDGLNNKATTLTDNDASGYEAVTDTITISDNSNTYTTYYLIKKDVDESSFPEFQLRLQGGTEQYTRVQINKNTGATTVAASVGSVNHYVIDVGNWWMLVLLVTNNSTGNTTARLRCYPAVTTILGSVEVAATGSCIIGHVQTELDTSVPSSPIETNGATATRNADDLLYNISNIQSDQGSALATVQIPTNWVGSLSGASYRSIIGSDTINSLALGIQNSTGYPLIWESTNNDLSIGTATITEGLQSNLASRWDTELQVLLAGTSYTADTNWTSFTWGNNLEIGDGGGVDRSSGPITIKNILIYNKDLGTTKLESLTAYD